jgi:hypothetical protein
MPAPGGVPLSVSCHSLLSRIPARNHWRMSLRMRGSAILCATIRSSHSWSTERKSCECRHRAPSSRAGSSAPCAAPREPCAGSVLAESRGEAEKIDLIEGAEKLGDGTLDDLVLQSRHAERALPTIGFCDVDTLERRDVDMMQQGCEPGLGGLSGRRVHPRGVGRQGCPALRPEPWPQRARSPQAGPFPPRVSFPSTASSVL